jgi:hypothetical protein
LDEVLFEAQSPLSYSVTLARATWEYHAAKRPEIRDQLDNVRLTVEDPDIIIRAGTRADYYRMGHGSGKTSGCYLHVLLRDQGSKHVIASVWFTRDLEKRGEVLWRRTP